MPTFPLGTGKGRLFCFVSTKLPTLHLVLSFLSPSKSALKNMFYTPETGK
jgi:hypothetical protein